MFNGLGELASSPGGVNVNAVRCTLRTVDTGDSRKSILDFPSRRAWLACGSPTVKHWL